MLEMKAIFTKKATDYPVWDCCIEKVVELSSKEFDDFVNDPCAGMDFIEENKDLMLMDQEGQYHCILVLGEDRSDGVLIESEGYDYARYSSYVPQARAYIERELEQLCDLFRGTYRSMRKPEHRQYTLMTSLNSPVHTSPTTAISPERYIQLCRITHRYRRSRHPMIVSS